MRILLTGATGYVGKRLLPVLIEQGHSVVCVVRDKQRFRVDEHLRDRVEVVQVDFLHPNWSTGSTPSTTAIMEAPPKNIDVAYYLIHSMAAHDRSGTTNNFQQLEAIAAQNARDYIELTGARQVIYLSGIVNEQKLSPHLASRKNVEGILEDRGRYATTILRAGIIVGSGSASFEIIRDLCEKLPVMITPKWVLTRCQPIAIRDIISYLTKVILDERTYGKAWDIGGPDILTYKQMMLGYCKVRGLKRTIITVPFMSPRLSAYWLFFVTSTSFTLARNLVDSMKTEVVCRDSALEDMLQVKPVSYEEALHLAFEKTRLNLVISSWKDAFSSSRPGASLNEFVEVPSFGCFKDKQAVAVKNRDQVIENIWAIGGGRGWYYGNRLWKFRGFLDKMFGGVGLRRGRTNPTELHSGDALDFWRVLFADKAQGRLLLFAEMKLPGEAWLEFRLGKDNTLYQTATFRPKGLWGRLYWTAMLPFHYFVFAGMIRNIAKA